MAELLFVDGPDEAGAIVADAILDLVERTPTAVLGVATGSTPTPVYRALAAGPTERMARARAFALDEYVGLSPDDPRSYHHVIRTSVTEPLGLDPANVHVPSGDPTGLREVGERYERAISEAGGIDLQLLGIGTDGHIGFNEPGSSLGSRTRVKTLTEQTRRDNARFFDTLDDVPMHCVTQGLGTIREARHLVLLAFGDGKADALAAAVEGPVTATVPASAIQLHPHVTVLVDEAAGSRLANAEYYRHAQRHKPAWQGI
jgi:glucosamine-6-phosphate deaminase